MNSTRKSEVLKFQVLFYAFVQNTSKYCKRFSQDYLQGKTIQILETNKYLVLKLFHEIFEFQMKRGELSKFKISFYDIS